MNNLNNDASMLETYRVKTENIKHKHQQILKQKKTQLKHNVNNETYRQHYVLIN